MTKEKVLELLEESLEDNTDVYNKVGEGDMTFSEVGDYFHSCLGYETIQALKNAIELLKEEK